MLLQNNKFEKIILKEDAFLTKKAIHTKYKIQYVSEYAKNWAYVSSNNMSTNINFIDCMCNAGIYKDGDFCSAIEVLKIFRECAYKYPEKRYNLFLNDYDDNKIRIIKNVCSNLYASYPSNLHIYYDTKDVNDYLYDVKKVNKELFTFPSMTLLYVDPYNFHAVKIQSVVDFIKNTYCELLFNLFTSDFNRNKLDAGIIEVLGGNYDIKNIEGLVEHIIQRFSVGKMKFFLSYPFRQQKNVELYQIFFASPNEKGLDKLKEALWKVFQGTDYYKTDLTRESGQLSLFSNEDTQDMAAKGHSQEIIDKLIQTYSKQEVGYEAISNFVTMRSLLKSTQIINYIIKPLLKNNILTKRNLAQKNNYKKDRYLFNE